MTGHNLVRRPNSLISQALDDYFTGFWNMPSSRVSTSNDLLSNVSLYEQGENFILQLPIPGAVQENVDVSVNGRTVTIRAATEFPVPEGAKLISGGASTTTIFEQFTLPTEVYSDEAEAAITNGILTVTMPKAERSHTIKVTQK